jgi:hypothetical protein
MPRIQTCTNMYKSYFLYEFVQVMIFVQERTSEEKRDISAKALQFRRIGAAGGRHDAVFAQVEGHLAVVVGGVSDNHGGEAQARIRPGVGALDGVEHVLGVQSAKRFANRDEGIAQIDQ